MATTKGGRLQREAGPVCAICRKPVGKQQRAKAKSGKTVHASCLQQAVRAGTRGTAAAAPPGPEARRTVPEVPEPRSVPPTSAPSPESGRPSRYPGRCPTCATAYPAGTPVVKVFAGWAHARCVFPGGPPSDFDRNKAAVLGGATFRGQAPGTWRRKSRRA